MDRRDFLQLIGVASVAAALPPLARGAENGPSPDAPVGQVHEAARIAQRPVVASPTLQSLLEECRAELPDGVHFYTLGGQLCWAVYSADGGLSLKSMAYLQSARQVNVSSLQFDERIALGRGSGTTWELRRTTIEFDWLDFAPYHPDAARNIVRFKVKAALADHLRKCELA